MKSYAEIFKEKCAKWHTDDISVARYDEAPIVEKEVIQPLYLYNIVKRSTNGKLNKVVCIGFTLDEAKQWLERKVSQAKENDDTIIFYDIVNQENKEELDPLWNPRPFFIGEAI